MTSLTLIAALISKCDADPGAHVALLVLLGAAFVAWLALAVPYGVTALLLVLTADVLGIAGGGSPFVGFGQPAFFFLIGVLFVAAAVNGAGTADRLSQRLIGKRARLTSLDLLWRVPLLLFASSAVISSATARVGLLHPLSRTIAHSGSQVQSDPGKYLLLHIGNLSPLTSRAFLSGGPGVIVAADLMASAGHRLNWLQWVYWLGVPVFLMVGLATLLHWIWLRPEPVHAATTPPEPLRPLDRRIVVVIVGMIALWIVGPVFNVGPAATAVLGAIVLASHDISGTARAVDWDLVLFSGATLSFGYILIDVGTAEWLGEAFLGLLRLWAGSAFLVPVAFLTLVLLRFPLNNGVAYSAVIFPIILNMEPIAEIQPLHLAFMALVAGGLAFLPIQSPPAMISYSLGRYTLGEAAKSGFLIVVCSVLVFQFFAIPYWFWLARTLE